ncbi:carotenoid 1,2-hydratase [Longibacter salinarum]|uniref:Carotenoid 1,2-hydratase n=1 Tax=Longibacter salinarum TaxID=1850348 RepID=A0A2A8CZ10_9BACT|nr:lipocalin-like domain-containing protein [Longibacter salinarum]PEN13628.1 carotenoid 1,2-hydratase [Longibacter salinarum]
MRRTVLIFALIVGVLGAAVYWLTNRTDQEAALDTSVAVAEAMGDSDTTGYARADRVVDFSFPEDHGPHPGFKTEWWYITGNLDSEGAATIPGQQPGSSARDFGFELTIFRVAMRPPSQQPVRLASGDSARSTWSTDQMYMGHFAVSDITNETQYDVERFSRGAAGLAGAQADPFRVWLDDWSIATVDTADAPLIDGAFPVRLRAHGNNAAADLILTPTKEMVLQGDRGLSQKGEGEGNASYYYTYPRLATEGTIVIDGDSVEVSGLSWMDREWSTSALSENQVGWDWFALQLDDGRDLMYYQLRNKDGSASRYTDGVVVGPDGSTTPIDKTDTSLEVLDTYMTPDGTREYPTAWHLRIPSQDIDLRINAAFDDQELNVSVRYWEGAVTVDGSSQGESVRGHGYVEMTGYGEGATSPTVGVQ